MRGSIHPPTVPLGVRVAPSTQARDKPPPLFTHEGVRPAPVSYARKGGAGQETRTPPPPPLTRERGTSPRHCSRRSHLRARGGGHRNEVYGTDARRGTVWDKARAPPLSPLARDRARNARGSVAPPPPPVRAQRPPANEGSARGDESRRAPTPLPRPPLYARAVRERGRALQVGVRPPLPGFARTGNVRTGTHRSGAPSTTQVRAPGQHANGQLRGSPPPLLRVRAPGQHANGQPRGSPPLPRVRAPGQRANGQPRGSPLSPAGSHARAKRERATAQKPPPLPQVRARAKRERAAARKPPLSREFARQGKTRTGDHVEAPAPPVGSARKGKTRPRGHAGSAPLRVCTPGARGSGGA
ncbi:hypothetical protein EDB83DRAFT_2318473 [Lactarius deliciosus]|nr:hypothetical protein EDB83DRAFT_2318473 [Lactarius deliciosus]